MPESQQPPQPPRYTVTMGGGEWSTAQYGIVEFLRAHRFYRALVGVLGVACGLLLIVSLAGVKIPGSPSFYIFYLVAPWLLWLGTVSGPSFQLIFAAAKESNDRQLAEKQFEQSRAPEDALNVDFTRLNEYYAINQAQARSSFRWAILSMSIGLGTIVAGIWFFYLRTSQPDKFMASLSTAAGIIANLIAVLFLRLPSQTQQRSFLYYEQLASLQKVTLAIRLINDYGDSERQTEARDLVIQQLLSQSSAPATLQVVPAKGNLSLPRRTRTAEQLKDDSII
jgi:hypothetical protein